MTKNNTGVSAASNKAEKSFPKAATEELLGDISAAKRDGWVVSHYRDGDKNTGNRFTVFHRTVVRPKAPCTEQADGANLVVDVENYHKNLQHNPSSEAGVKLQSKAPAHILTPTPATAGGGDPQMGTNAAVQEGGFSHPTDTALHGVTSVTPSSCNSTGAASAAPNKGCKQDEKQDSNNPSNSGGDNPDIDPAAGCHTTEGQDSDNSEGIDFSQLPSVKGMAPSAESINIGFDTEFYYPDPDSDQRVILSYQFAVINIDNDDLIEHIVAIPLDGARLSLPGALSLVVEKARLHEHRLAPPVLQANGIDHRSIYTPEFRKKYNSTLERYESGSRQQKKQLKRLRDDAQFEHKLSLTLICHFGVADMSAFAHKQNSVDIMPHLISVARGLVTEFPARVRCWDDNYLLPVSLTVRDTVTQSAAGSSTLKALGKVCGVEKMEMSLDEIKNMDTVMRDNLCKFLEYGINDSVICIEYLSAIWGDWKQPAMSLSSSAAASARVIGVDYFGVRGTVAPRNEPGEFYREYAGLEKKVEGLDAVVDEADELIFYSEKTLQPTSPRGSELMTHAANSYRGGLNGCSRPGIYRHTTYDYDLQNAYPTMMSQVLDVDWEGDAIAEVIDKRPITLDDFEEYGPATPMFAAVTFEFPDDVAFPCLPMSAEAAMVYVLSSAGTAGAWCAGPEIYLALKLGAKVFASIGCIASVRKRKDGKPSKFLSRVVKQFITDRNLAKALYGKKSLQELVLKTAVNSLYGKTAQDVSPKTTWQAWSQQMRHVGGSTITSPVHAAMITSGIRAVLCAAMNQLEERGYHVYSYTTDGFISDAPFDVLKSLDLYGFAEPFAEARLFLTDGKDSSLWEVKHEQKDLLNITTRGNNSLSLGGVNAHNSYKSIHGYESDSAEDRAEFRKAVITRDGAVYTPTNDPTSFHDLSVLPISKRKDFSMKPRERYLSMDFDLKREPVEASMRPVTEEIDGEVYEVATFDTKPWETLSDALKGRRGAERFSHHGNGPLRTVRQWNDYFLGLQVAGSGRHIKNMPRAVLMTLAIAHRRQHITIPGLDGAEGVDGKCAWLEALGLGKFTRNDWKNARRPERESQMLPLERLEEVLDIVMGVGADAFPSHDDELRLTHALGRVEQSEDEEVE